MPSLSREALCPIGEQPLRTMNGVLNRIQDVFLADGLVQTGFLQDLERLGLDAGKH